MGRLRGWHRWTGVCVCVVVAILAVTGVLLNHTDSLELDRRLVTAAPVLRFYGLGGSDPVAEHVSTSAGQITRVQSVLYRDGDVLGEMSAPMSGAVAVQDLIVVAARDEVHLYHAAENSLVERMSPTFGLPVPVEKMGLLQGHAMILAAGSFWRFDGVDWVSASPSNEIHWSVPMAGVPAGFSGEIARTGVSLEHIVLDIHSGRVLGHFGPWLNDLGALGLCFLAVSGLWIAFRK